MDAEVSLHGGMHGDLNSEGTSCGQAAGPIVISSF